MEGSSSSQKAERNRGVSVAAEHALQTKAPTSEHLPQPLQDATETEPEVAAVVI